MCALATARTRGVRVPMALMSAPRTGAGQCQLSVRTGDCTYTRSTRADGTDVSPRRTPRTCPEKSNGGVAAGWKHTFNGG